MGDILYLWDNLPVYDRNIIGEEMYGDMSLADFIEIELPIMKKEITDTIKLSNQTFQPTKTRLEKIEYVLDRYSDFLDLSVLETKKSELESEIKGREEKEDIIRTAISKKEKGEITYTPQKREEERKREIEESNQSDLPTLSKGTPIETDSDKTNLKTLQFILLNNFFIDDESKEELKNEIKDEIFGDVTDTYVKLLQNTYNINEDGIVTGRIWDILMGMLSTREEEKLNYKEISSDLKELLSFRHIKTINTKEKLNKNASMRLFNNLLDFNIYKLEHTTVTPKNIKKDFDKLKEKFKVVDKRIPEMDRIDSDINNLKDEIRKYEEISPKSFKRKIKNLTKQVSGLESEKKKYEKYKDLIKLSYRDYNSALEQYSEKRLKNDERTVKGLFGKLKEVLDTSIRDKKYSIDEVNNLIFRVNDTLYNIFLKDVKDKTKKQKSRNAIKDIINTIDIEGNIEEIIGGLEKINTKEIAHYMYERSFCDCEEGYFTCSNLGDKSKIINNANIVLIEKLESGENTEKIATDLYDIIIKGKETKLDKFDIVAEKTVDLDGKFTIPAGSKIEVKKTEKLDYHLSEFFGVYKSRKNINTYSHQIGRYNEVIEKLVELLNQNDGGLIDSIVGEGSDLSGIFLDNYMFYPKGSYDLVWSTEGVGRVKDHRLTLRFKISGEGFQWSKGNCNKEDASTSYVNNVLGL
jgi:hypothetical protein